MRHLIRHLVTLLVVLLLGGLLGATLVRYSPGYGVSEEELDPRFRAESLEALRKAGGADRGALAFYFEYLRNLIRGDLGTSQALGWPVADLLAERIPVTFRTVGIGLLLGWTAGLTLSASLVLWPSPVHDLSGALVSGVFLCVPSALVALLFLHIEGPLPLALAAVVFPRIYRYSRNVLLETSRLPHVLLARAKGLRPAAVLWRHVLRPALPPIVSLGGVSVSLALGAAVPIEVICDEPGIGQLAWQAALARDLPLLVNLTLLVTLVTLTANAASDLAGQTWKVERR